MQEMTSKDIPNTDERFGNGHGESGWKWNKIAGVEAVGMGGKTAGKTRVLETKAQVIAILNQVSWKAGNFDQSQESRPVKIG